MGLSRLSAPCRDCPYVDTCDHKRMEAIAYLPEQNMAAFASSPIVADMVQPLTVKHDYRDVKIAEGMTITIDLEDIKRQMIEDYYPDILYSAF